MRKGLSEWLTPKSLAFSGLTGAAYVVLTLIFAPLAYGPIQVRISEVLTILPYFFPGVVPGLFVGCMIANFMGGFGLLDVIFGSAATLAAALLTARMPNLWLAPLPPVVVNMVVVGVYLAFLLDMPFLLCALYVGAGQIGACYFLGLPLGMVIEARLKKGGKNPAH